MATMVVPACEPGRGGGHIVRCMALVRDLRGRGREAWLFLPCAAAAPRLFDSANFDPAWLMGEDEWLARQWDYILLDRFQTPPHEFARWAAPRDGPAGGPLLIGIDEGGPCRSQFDFLIDLLPGGSHRTERPNIADPSLLPLPPQTGRPPHRDEKAPLKVLVSFGQEDAAGLGPAVTRALAGKNTGGGNTAAVVDITLLTGGLVGAAYRARLPGSPPLQIRETIPQLSTRLGEYDLVITHYGLTAFEAVYAGVPVLLASPTAYHEKIARAAGFYSVGIGKRTAAHGVRRLIRQHSLNVPFMQKLGQRRARLAARHHLEQAPRRSLAELVSGPGLPEGRTCPACGSAARGAVIARFTERTYRRCPACGIIGMSRLNPPPLEYGREYFFELYQRQYGKTYIEDFPHLIGMGKRRLAVIRSLLPAATAGGETRLLDIGCAYGPFLAAAREAGFSAFGIDPAADAVRYVTQTLNIPAVPGFFPCPLPEFPLHYDVVTLWYVIEHFQDCVPVLAEIRRMLKPGGVLALATPSCSGVSGRTSLKRFLEHSPADHWTIWSPGVCKKALAAAGFSVTKMVSSGHHPERFPVLGRFAAARNSPLYAVLLAISRLCSLGDTFEVYAVPRHE